MTTVAHPPPHKPHPHASHESGHGHPHGHGHDHAHPHGHPHGHGHDDSVAPMWKRAWFWGMALLLVALAIGAYVTKQTGDDARDEKSDTATLIAQIKAGSEGWVQGANVFGGELKSQGEGSRHGVIVTKIPSKVCVEAGLALAKDGIITVNGVMPPRVSAGKLAVLCNEGGNESTLSWVPR